MHTPRSSQPTTITGAAELIAQLQQKLGVATKTHSALVTKAAEKTAAIAAHDQAVTDAATKKKAAALLLKGGGRRQGGRQEAQAEEEVATSRGRSPRAPLPLSGHPRPAANKRSPARSRGPPPLPRAC